MFDEIPNQPRESLWIGPKILICAAAGVLLAFGLCGIGGTLHVGSGLGILGVSGVWLFAISVIAIVMGGIITLIEVIIATSRGK